MKVQLLEQGHFSLKKKCFLLLKIVGSEKVLESAIPFTQAFTEKI